MKKLIYSQEDLDLILSLEIQEKDKEIERLNKENKELKEQVVSAIRVNNVFTENKSIIELQAQRYEQELTITKEKQLKERIEYLERSNNRREDEILELRKENADLDNVINELEKHFVFLKMNSIGGNKEFFEDILEYIRALKELKGSDKE